MNQANTVCLLAIILVMYSMAQVLCFGLNPGNLGGWGPTMLMMVLPVAGYGLGRIWQRPTNRRSRRSY